MRVPFTCKATGGYAPLPKSARGCYDLPATASA